MKYEPGAFIFMQNGAPAHTSRKTQRVLRKHLGDDFWDKTTWPPASCDLNLLDFSV